MTGYFQRGRRGTTGAATGLAFALAAAAAASAQGVYGLGESAEPDPPPPPDIPVITAAPETVLRLPGFDPVRDVPAMRNWKGDIDNSGAGNCYALSNLTDYFYGKVEFVPGDEGVPFDEWDYRYGEVLRVDEVSLARLPHLLGRSLKDVANEGKLRLGGYADLAEFTAVRELTSLEEAGLEGLEGRERDRVRQQFSDRQDSTKAFRRWAEAAQYAMQIDGDGHRYVGSILKSKLGWVPGVNLGRDAVNQDGLKIVRNRLESGRPAIIAMHPAGVEFKGHVVVVYELRETPTRATLVAYDCNRPPADGAARPTIVRLKKTGGWEYEAFRHGDEPAYDYPIFTVTDPDSRRARYFFESTAGNAEEHLQRNRSLGDLVGPDRSLGRRIAGGVKFVGEVLNPF